MGLPREEFRKYLSTEFAVRPYGCHEGTVVARAGELGLGYPGGHHEPISCWIYERKDADLDLLFGFYSNFTPDDFVTKVLNRGSVPEDGAGASVQFNGDLSVLAGAQPGRLALVHHGKVTLRTGVKRSQLVAEIERIAPRAADRLGLIGRAAWPLVIGDTGNLPQLMDRLFTYAYAVEQAKRSWRREPLLPSLP